MYILLDLITSTTRAALLWSQGNNECVGVFYSLFIATRGYSYVYSLPLLTMTLCAPNVKRDKGNLDQKGLSDNTKVDFGATKNNG